MPPKAAAAAARPPPDPAPCARVFELIAPHIYRAYATADHICMTCGHPVHRHPPPPPHAAVPVAGVPILPVLPAAAGADAGAAPAALAAADPNAAVAAVEVVLGPSLLPPVDRGAVFLRVLDAWTLGPFCTDETDSAKAALQFLQSTMFNGCTSFIGGTFRVFGELDLNRTFIMRDGLDQDLEARRSRGRSIMDMAEIAVRAAIPLGRAIARHRHFVLHRPLPVQRSRSGISSEIAWFDELAARRIVLPPFQLMPAADSWSTVDGLVWWGLWMATAPPESVREAFERLVVRAGERFRAAHPDAFTDRITWEARYRSERARPGRRDVFSDDADALQPPPKYRRMSNPVMHRVAAGSSGPLPSAGGVPTPPMPPPSGGAPVGGQGRGAFSGRVWKWNRFGRGRGGRGGGAGRV